MTADRLDLDALGEARRRIEEAVNVAHNSWVNLDGVPDIGGLWVNQEEILDALTGDESIEIPIWRDAWDEERQRADRAETERDAAQAALARVERLLIEARSLIATTGTGREAQIIKEALATIRAAADERQEAGGK